MSKARKEFYMDKATYDSMLVPASRVMLVGGVNLADLAQMDANTKWEMLGKKMGFIGDTARAIPGKGPQYFSAIPTDEDQNEPA